VLFLLLLDPVFATFAPLWNKISLPGRAGGFFSRTARNFYVNVAAVFKNLETGFDLECGQKEGGNPGKIR